MLLPTYPGKESALHEQPSRLPAWVICKSPPNRGQALCAQGRACPKQAHDSCIVGAVRTRALLRLGFLHRLPGQVHEATEVATQVRRT